MISNSMTTKMQQKFAPSQIQYMKLLEMPTTDLEQRIEEEVENNPLLEENKKEDESIDSPIPKKDAYGMVRSRNRDNNPMTMKADPGSFNSGGVSLYDTLLEQLGLAHLSDLDVEIGKEIIGNINDNGYLERTPEAIADDFFTSHYVEITTKQVEDVLKVIQNFDPAGVGAQNLQECLTLQAKRIHANGEDILLAKKIVMDDNLFNMLKNRQYQQLLSKLSCSNEELIRAENVIRQMNPKPSTGSGNIYENVYIKPDFLIWNDNGRVDFQLTKTFDKTLNISPHYAKMLDSLRKSEKNKENKQAVAFLKEKMDKANRFMLALARRDETLRKVMAAIIKFQYSYFLDGDISKLKPMRLVDIAEMTGNDISTISRFTNNKYAQTHFGLFQLKQFFSNAVEDGQGNQVSSDAIKSIIMDQIKNENKQKPLTDEKLASILKDAGYNLARRTVAKYRDSLNIPVARLRKTIL